MVNTRSKGKVAELSEQSDTIEISGDSDTSVTSIQRRSTRRSVTSKELPITPVRRSRRLSNSSIESANDSPAPGPTTRRRSIRSGNADATSSNETNESAANQVGGKKRKLVEDVEMLTIIDEEKVDMEVKTDNADPIAVIDLDSEDVKEEPSSTANSKEATTEVVDITTDKEVILLDHVPEACIKDAENVTPVNNSNERGSRLEKTSEESAAIESNKETKEPKIDDGSSGIIDTADKKIEETDSAEVAPEGEPIKDCLIVEAQEETVKDCLTKNDLENSQNEEKQQSESITKSVPEEACSQEEPKENKLDQVFEKDQENAIKLDENSKDNQVVPLKEQLKPKAPKSSKKKRNKPKKMDAPAKNVQEEKATLEGAEIMQNIPRGRPVSGRVWKNPKSNPRYMYKDKGLKMPFEKIMQLREERKRIKMHENRLKEEEKLRREDLNRRRQLNKQRQEENTKKGEVVQVIRNMAKLKRMSKKQLRLIQKRDTSAIA